MRTVPRFVQLELPVEFPLLDVREDQDSPAVQGLTIGAVHDGWRHLTVRALIVVHGQGQEAQRSVGAVPCFLKGAIDTPEESSRGNNGECSHEERHPLAFPLVQAAYLSTW